MLSSSKVTPHPVSYPAHPSMSIPNTTSGADASTPLLRRPDFSSRRATEKGIASILRSMCGCFGVWGAKGNADLICDVSVGQAKTVRGNETLSTMGLGDCIAVTLLIDRHPETGVYAERTMLHINGGDLANAWFGEPAGQVITKLIDQHVQTDNHSQHKMIVAFGTQNTSDLVFQSFFERQYQGRSQLLECAKLCKGNIAIQTGSHSIKVASDGAILRDEDDTLAVDMSADKISAILRSV